jgi:hypothetical protein
MEKPDAFPMPEHGSAIRRPGGTRDSVMDIQTALTGLRQPQEDTLGDSEVCIVLDGWDVPVHVVSYRTPRRSIVLLSSVLLTNQKKGLTKYAGQS